MNWLEQQQAASGSFHASVRSVLAAFSNGTAGRKNRCMTLWAIARTRQVC